MLLVCPHCATRNRVPEQRIADDPVCGRCGKSVAPRKPIALGDTELAGYLQGARPEIRFVKVDSDAAPHSSANLQIRSIPTTVLFVGGRETARQSGAMTAAQLGAWIDRALH